MGREKRQHKEASAEKRGEKLRACLHGGGGPQIGEVTRIGVVCYTGVVSVVTQRGNDTKNGCVADWHRWGNPPVHIISHFNVITFTC